MTGISAGKTWSRIGAEVAPTSSAASGVWQIQEVAENVGAGTWPSPPAHWEALQTTSGTTGVASIEFTSIPQTYKELRVVYVGSSSGKDSFFFNMGTGGAAVDTTNANYGMTGFSYWSSSSRDDTQSAWRKHPNYFPYQVSTTNDIPSIGIWSIPNYTSTTFYKVSQFYGSTRNEQSTNTNSNSYGAAWWSGLTWKNTGAVDRLQLAPDGGITLQNYTCTLFGIGQ